MYQNISSVTSNNLSLKYQRVIHLGFKYIGIRKAELVATQFVQVFFPFLVVLLLPNFQERGFSTENFETQSNICDETDQTRKSGDKPGLSRTTSKHSRSLSPNPSRNPSRNISRNPSRNQSPRGSKGASRASSPFPWNNALNFNATLPAAPPNHLDSNDPALPLMLCSLLQREFCMKSPRRQRKNTSSKVSNFLK